MCKLYDILKEALDWLNNKKFTTVFVDENHENYTRLYNDYPVEEWHGGKAHKIRDFSWWDLELPTKEEMQNGINNLEKVNYKVDYIISHCCPTSIQTILGSGTYKKDYLTDYFQNIMENVSLRNGILNIITIIDKSIRNLFYCMRILFR